MPRRRRQSSRVHPSAERPAVLTEFEIACGQRAGRDVSDRNLLARVEVNQRAIDRCIRLHFALHCLEIRRDGSRKLDRVTNRIETDDAITAKADIGEDKQGRHAGLCGQPVDGRRVVHPRISPGCVAAKQLALQRLLRHPVARDFVLHAGQFGSKSRALQGVGNQLA